MIRLLLPLLLLGLSGVPFAKAQQPMAVALHAGVSHSGWNLALVGQYHYKDFAAYLGPSISLNRGVPNALPFGFDTGLDYRIASRKDWLSSVVNLDYQFHAFPGKDQIHEFHLSYGLKFQTSSGFFVIQQLGYGMYLENAFIEATQKRRTFSGYDGLVRLRAGYNF